MKRLVLILVLMDNQNTFMKNFKNLVCLVLILVLMDNQNTYYYSLKNILLCLNPCSNG